MNKYKKTKTMKLHEIINEIKSQLVCLEEENLKTTQVSRKNARRAAGEIKKLAVEFKRVSSAEDKA